MDFFIRLACLEDIPKLTTLIPDSARALQADYYTSEQIEGALGTVFGVDSQLIQDRTYFVAERDRQIVGCGGWSKRKTLYGGDSGKNNQEDSLLNPDTDSAKIRAFFVDPVWARQGLAVRLCNPVNWLLSVLDLTMWRRSQRWRESPFTQNLAIGRSSNLKFRSQTVSFSRCPYV